MRKHEVVQWAKVREKITQERKLKRLSPLTSEIVAKLHAEVFNHKYVTPCRSCGTKWFQFIDELEKVYQTAIKTKRVVETSNNVEDEEKRKRSEAAKKAWATKRQKASEAASNS